MAEPARATTKRRYASLPPNLPPRGLDRPAAAAYIGVSPAKFDELVTDKRMPKARRIDGRIVWDIRELDSAFDALPHTDEAGPVNEWDEILVNAPHAVRP